MKLFFGQYFDTFKQAEKAYNKLSPAIQKRKSLCEINKTWFIVANSTIKAFNKKK